MEYMEQQMQQQIDAGINERERCYTEIAELEMERDKYKELYESSMLAEATAKQYAEEIDKQNQALAVQVEALRAAGNEVYAELQQWALTESHKETDRVFALWRKARAATPQHHLAEIRAQAVMDAVVSHEVKYGNSQFGRHLREYADSIRRGEVE